MLHNGRSKSLNTSGIFFLLTASLHWETEGVFGSFFSWLVGMWEVVFFFTCSNVQKMWASSCWKRLTRVKPLKVPESSFRWRTPKSASLRGNSLQDRGRWANIKLKGTWKNLLFILLTEDLRQHRNKESSVQTVITFLSIYSFRLSASWKTGKQKKHTTQKTAKDHLRKNTARTGSSLPSWNTTSDAHLYPTELVFTSGTN